MLSMDVTLVLYAGLQVMFFPAAKFILNRTTYRIIIVKALEGRISILCRIGVIVIGKQLICKLIKIQTGFQATEFAQSGVTDEVQALFIPGRPIPKSWTITQIWRIALLSFLQHISQCVFLIFSRCISDFSTRFDIIALCIISVVVHLVLHRREIF